MHSGKKNSGWWLSRYKSICINKAVPRRSKSRIWHEVSGTWAHLPFLGHGAQRTVVTCTPCLKLQGTELLSSNFAHSVTPLMPEQIKWIECRNAASCDLTELHSRYPSRGILHLSSCSSSLPHPSPQPLLFQNLGHLAYTKSASPKKTAFVQPPRVRIK